MKRILSFLVFLFLFLRSFSQIPDTTGPFRALEMWHYDWLVPYPINGSPQAGNLWDIYYRFSWGDIETINSVSSQYYWTKFDAEIHRAMDNRAKFNFAVMPYYSGAGTAITVSGATLSYPLYVHNQMQAESVKDWISTSEGAWVQDWNSPSYISAWTNLQNSIANHIATTSYKPSWSSVSIPYSKVIGYIDIRSYGNFGEWHSAPWGTETPAGESTPYNLSTRPMNYASMKKLTDAYIAAFPNFWLDIGMQSFGNAQYCGNPYNLTDPQIGYYALTAKNNKGLLGWRRDNWGWNQPFYTCNLEGNTITYNGISFANEAMNRWKYAPIGGEPIQCCTTDNGAAGDYYYDLLREVTSYRPTSIGNGNMDNPTNPLTVSRFQQVGSLMGYKLQIKNDSISKNLTPGGSIKVYSTWTNRGLTPNYEDWNVKYQLRNGSGAISWEGASSFSVKMFLPSVVSNIDTYTLPSSLPTGTYSLYVKVIDPTGYRLPLILRQTGKTADTSYLLNSSIVVGTSTSPTNLAPIASALSDTVQLPITTGVLDGRASTDPDGTISSYNWVQQSGPIFGTIQYPDSSLTNVLNLTLAGTYSFSLTVTDNQGAKSTTSSSVVVKSQQTGLPMNVSVYNSYGQFMAKKVVYSYSLQELKQGLHLRRGVYIAKYDTGVTIQFYVSVRF